jgi:hypothetical protein
MLAVELAVLAQLNFSLDIAPVFCGCIILSLALGALKGNFLYRTFFLTSHNVTPFQSTLPADGNDDTNKSPRTDLNR